MLLLLLLLLQLELGHLMGRHLHTHRHTAGRVRGATARSGHGMRVRSLRGNLRLRVLCIGLRLSSGLSLRLGLRVRERA